jgi:hypothetical protein
MAMPPVDVLRGADVKHVPELSPRRVLHALETQPCEAGGDVRGVPGAQDSVQESVSVNAYKSKL